MAEEDGGRDERLDVLEDLKTFSGPDCSFLAYIDTLDLEHWQR